VPNFHFKRLINTQAYLTENKALLGVLRITGAKPYKVVIKGVSPSTYPYQKDERAKPERLVNKTVLYLPSPAKSVTHFCHDF
jgi:hypothetical protein